MSTHKILGFCFIVLAIFVANTTVSHSDENQRPSANNKVKHTKKSAEERENSIINRILKNDVFTSQESESKEQIDEINSYELVINQIKTLSELNRDGFLTNEEFEAKKAILLERIQ
tara:strand:+ start:182 stop:529 length:348 start_codon:yes stop_codon:yes gene_type:complete